MVSFPKSGRTWLRVLLDRLGIPLAYTHDTFDDPHADRSRYAGRRIVLLVRDPRDTAVSLYYQLTKRDMTFTGTLSDLIRDERYGVAAILRFQSDWHGLATSWGDFHVVRYEDLRANSAPVLRDLLAFLGLTVSEQALADAIAFASFDNMQEMEASGALRRAYGDKLVPAHSSDPDSFKVRKGTVGGYSDAMSEADVAYCAEILQHSPNPYYAPTQ